jgi:hypothetical protein
VYAICAPSIRTQTNLDLYARTSTRGATRAGGLRTETPAKAAACVTAHVTASQETSRAYRSQGPRPDGT